MKFRNGFFVEVEPKMGLLDKLWDKIVKSIRKAVEYLGRDFTGWWGF